MSTNHEFDLIVLGAGTGGNGVARMAVQAGWNVASVDPLPYGGTCALRGCDPKKMLVAVTEGVDWVNNLKGKGLEADVSVNWPDMIAFKRTFTDVMPPRIEAGLKNAGITTLHGEARFTGPDTIEINGQLLRSLNFHIATGARPMTLNIPGEDLLTTSTDFLALPEKPQRIAFVGGGFIAMEFAHIANRAGAAEVTVLEMMKRPLGNFDPDLVNLLVEATEDLGIDLKTEAKVLSIEESGKTFVVTYESPSGKEQIIFAAGDCADSGPNLTPVSANEARIAGKNLLAGKDERAVNYPPIPSVVFTLPQLATVGLSEAAAREQNLAFDVHFEKTDDWYSSLRVGAKRTAFKVLVEKETGLILGAHLMGPGAEEQINLFAMAMGTGIPANKIKGMIFAYPSYASDIGSMV